MTAGSTTRDSRECAAEIKFLLSPATAARLRERARSLLSPDPHAGGPNADEYTTTSIYFDTPDFAVYNRRGSYRRAKYRIRRYGSGAIVFLERKLRTSRCVSKRRTTVGVEDLPLLTSSSVDRSWSGAWFHDRLLARRLAPVAEVSYQRTARVGMTDYGPMRLTVDEHVVGMAIDTPCFLQLDSALPLTSSAILELKFRGPMPAVFKRIVEEFALVARPVSKYRLAMQATRAVLRSEKRVETLLKTLNRIEGMQVELLHESADGH